MASLRKKTRKGKNGRVDYWVVDYSLTEQGKIRRRQEHFRIDPAEPHKARLTAEHRKAEIDRKLARRKLLGSDALDDGPVDVEIPDWLDAFCRAVRPNCSDEYHRNIVGTLRKLRSLLAGWGVLTTAQLRRQAFSDFVSAMQQGGNSPRTIHNNLTIVKRALQWGIDEGWLDPRLIRSFPAVKVPKKRRRALSREEVDQLLSAAEGHDLYEPILVALYTGARRGELVALQCSDVDLDRNVVRFRAEIAKAGEHGDVPIHTRLRPFLEGRADETGPLVRRKGDRAWATDAITHRFTPFVKKELGWDDVTFHCLRHTFGTLLAASGKVTPFQLQKLMRHKHISTSMIYVDMAAQTLPAIDVF